MDDLGYLDRVDTDCSGGEKKEPLDLLKSDHLLQLDEDQFRRRYRMSKASFMQLLNLIIEELNWANNRNHPTPPHIQLQVALRFYATGSFQLVQGDLLGLSQPTVSRIVRRVSEIIAGHSKDFIKFPSPAECHEVRHSLFAGVLLPIIVSGPAKVL